MGFEDLIALGRGLRLGVGKTDEAQLGLLAAEGPEGLGEAHVKTDAEAHPQALYIKHTRPGPPGKGFQVPAPEGGFVVIAQAGAGGRENGDGIVPLSRFIAHTPHG
jgi:hypothetical protein